MKKDAREKCGLTGAFVDIKDLSKDPTLNYIENPGTKTQNELELKRK